MRAASQANETPGRASSWSETRAGADWFSYPLISTSEIKITVVIDEKYAELAVRVLHKAFELDQA